MFEGCPRIDVRSQQHGLLKSIWRHGGHTAAIGARPIPRRGQKDCFEIFWPNLPAGGI